MANREHRRELADKVTALVRGRFGGDYPAAFRHYDVDGDGVIDKAGLKALLADAGIGNALTRWAWATGLTTRGRRFTGIRSAAGPSRSRPGRRPPSGSRPPGPSCPGPRS